MTLRMMQAMEARPLQYWPSAPGSGSNSMGQDQIASSCNIGQATVPPLLAWRLPPREMAD